MLYHCRMWCYAIGVEAVVLRSWYVVLCTVCQLVSNCIVPVILEGEIFVEEGLLEEEVFS